MVSIRRIMRPAENMPCTITLNRSYLVTGAINLPDLLQPHMLPSLQTALEEMFPLCISEQACLWIILPNKRSIASCSAALLLSRNSSSPSAKESCLLSIKAAIKCCSLLALREYRDDLYTESVTAYKLSRFRLVRWHSLHNHTMLAFMSLQAQERRTSLRVVTSRSSYTGT